jgi:hypothetical protein
MHRVGHASTTAAASCCSSARRTWATGNACRRVFAGDDFLTVAYARHGARDDMASAEAWYPFGQGGSPHSPGGPLTALAADAPKESTAGPRCRSGWKLAGGLQSGARAAHPVPSRACPAQACPGFFLALGRSPGCTRCGRARTCCCRRHRAAPRDGCCSSQLAVPDRFKETGQRAFALVRRPTTAIVAAVRQGSIRPAWARATAPPSR